MRVIVTGGAGFIGSHLVDRLAQDRVGEIVVIDNLARGRWEHLAAHALDPAVRRVEGDIRDAALLMAEFEGADVVYHLAAQSNVMGAVTDVGYSFTTNVGGTFNVLEAARARAVGRVVFTSSREVYGDAEALPVDERHRLEAKNAYGASEAAGDGRSRLDRRPARSVEVARFVADVSRMRAHLGLTPPDDPLFALPRLWEAHRRGATA